MAPLPVAHRRRLRAMWRGAGWPCRDTIEIDLLAAGLLERVFDAEGRETLRVTDAGVSALAAQQARHRAALDAHEALRAPLAGDDGRPRWVMARPDVFSIRYTTLEDYVDPVARAIKVRRANLRKREKGRAYRALASQCWYALAEGVGDADEVPLEYGVLLGRAGRLDLARPALRRPLPAWMALARAAAEAPADPALVQPGLPSEAETPGSAGRLEAKS